MQYFNFKRLIQKYQSEFKAITLVDGQFNEKGDFVKGEKTEKVIYGAIISHKESRVLRADGLLSANDKRLFMLEPIEKALLGSKAVYDGRVYNIEDCTQNAKFTGVWAYTLKYVSAFDDEGGAADD